MDETPPSTEARRSLLAPDVSRWPNDPERPILELERVHKSFGGNTVIRDLTLKIPTGQTTVIIGESGSGKSVLLKMMSGLIRADKGVVRLLGDDLSRLGSAALFKQRKRTSMVLQNYALFDSMNVLNNIGFPLVQHTSMPPKEIDERAMDLLEMLELTHAAKMFPSALSGGMKKRVSFARAVISQPELVFFDEPTTGLDPVMIEFVDGLIQKMQARFQITSVIISHDISSIFNLADQIAMLHGGTIIAAGPTEEMRRSSNKHVARFISVGGSGRLSAESAREDEASTEGAEGAQKKCLVKLIEVNKHFGTNHVLKGVNLEIMPREITVIIGGSGSGKSVIIKHIIGLFRATSGQVLFDGQDLGKLDEKGMRALRSRVGMLFQGAALFDSMSVWDNVCFPLVERGTRIKKQEVERRVQDVLERLHLEHLAKKFPTDISAGQRKRVGLARAIVTEPEVMIYDEPTTGQDPIMIRYVDDMIVEAHEEFNLTTIVISHDMQSTFRISDRIAMLHKGQMVAVGSPKEVFEIAKTSDIVRRFVFAGSPEAHAPASP